MLRNFRRRIELTLDCCSFLNDGTGFMTLSITICVGFNVFGIISTAAGVGNANSLVTDT
jgi:hypothetical protein